MLTRLKLERQKRGLKSKELAKRVSVHPSYITLMENGREPSKEIKKRIAKVMRLPVKTLWEGKSSG